MMTHLSALLPAAALKATVILLLAAALCAVLRKSAASVRYLVWTFAVAAVLAIPLLSPVVHWEFAAPVPAPALDAGGGETAAEPAAAAAQKETGSWIAPLWLAGFGIALFPFAAGFVRVRKLVNRAQRLEDPAWRDSIADAAMRVRSRVRFDVRRSVETDVPLSCGMLTPVIVLPWDAVDWDGERRLVVLMHEAVHIGRHDSLLHTLGQLARAAYWFHPLAWIALSRLRLEQERSCDDAVLRAGAGQSAYAGHLVSLARSAAWTPVALPMAARSGLEKRIEALLDPGRSRAGVTRSGMAAALACAVACVVPLAALRGQTSGPVASLAGSVYDASGAAIPKAMVLLKNANKTNQEQTRAGEDGSYRFARVAAGTYDVEVRAPGFALGRVAGLVLSPAAAQTLDVKLNLGAISENIEVVGKGPRPAPSGTPKRIRVGGNVQATRLVTRVKPVYPPEAQAAGIEGTVLLRAVISTDGSLLGLSVMNSAPDPALVKAATDAVSQWRYQPTLLNGAPVEVVTTVAVDFRLEP